MGPWAPAGREARLLGSEVVSASRSPGLPSVLSPGGQMVTGPPPDSPGDSCSCLARAPSGFCCLVGFCLGVGTLRLQRCVLTFKHEFYFALFIWGVTSP